MQQRAAESSRASDVLEHNFDPLLSSMLTQQPKQIWLNFKLEYLILRNAEQYLILNTGITYGKKSDLLPASVQYTEHALGSKPGG